MVTKLDCVVIKGNTEKEREVLERLREERHFHIDSAFDLQSGEGLTPSVRVDGYSAAFEKLSALCAELETELKPKKAPGEMSSELITKEAESLLERIRDIKEKRNSIITDINEKSRISDQLTHFIGSDVNVGDLKNMRFFDVRFGKIPRSGYESLGRYEDLADKYFFKVSSYEKNYVWGVYITPKQFSEEVSGLFEMLHFTRTEIPYSVDAGKTPEKLCKELSAEIEKGKEEVKSLKTEYDGLRKRAILRADELQYYAEQGETEFETERNIAHSGNEFTVVGYVPSRASAKLCADLERIGVSAVSETKKPSEADTSSDLTSVPTLLRNLWFLRPFEEFVKMYGPPSYNEVDPTPLVAITYMLFFGMMFGDLGQGLLIIAAGAVLWFWKKNFIGRILTRVGITASVFGLIYGSFFGYEGEIIPGVEFSPMEHIDKLLVYAVGLGIVIIAVAMLFNVANGIKQRSVDKALLSSNGLCGILLYLSVVALIVNMLLGLNLPSLPFVITAVICSVVVLMHRPIAALLGDGEMPEDGMGGYIIESFFELFEVFLSFFSNTLSYLRVGVFALSHVGMMTVVFLLADGGKNIPVMIVGNIFVTAFEGMIVCIQALRLEFYEIFSRFYDGGGREFISYGKLKNK